MRYLSKLWAKTKKSLRKTGFFCYRTWTLIEVTKKRPESNLERLSISRFNPVRSSTDIVMMQSFKRETALWLFLLSKTMM